MNNSVEVSVVAPMYNEEKCVHEFVSRVITSLAEVSFEIILVDDGSTDKTARMLDGLSKGDKRIRYISLSRNRGQSMAVYCGFQHSSGKYVVMMDGDLQNRPEDILTLVEKAKEGFDLVSGLRSGRKESLLIRRIPSMVANWLIRSATGCQVKDMGGFKCLKGDVARNIHFRNGYHRLLPALTHTMGGSTTEIPVEHAERAGGVSKYGTVSRMIDVVFDIIMLWFLNASKSRPLYLFGKLSIIQLFFSGIIFIWLLVSKFVYGEDIGGRPLFFLDLVLFGTGLLTMCMGILSELIVEIHGGFRDSKPYIVKYDSYKN